MEMQKNKTANLSIIGSIIAAICIAIYLLAIVQGSVRIYLNIDQRKTTAEREFSQIAAQAIFAGRNGFLDQNRNIDQNFFNTMNTIFASTKTIEALIITGAGQELVFEKRPGYAVTWIGDLPRFINKIHFSNQNRPLPIADLRNANIQAVATVFDYNESIKILKETLIIILVGFAIAFITLLLQILTKKQIKGEMIYVSTPKSRKEKIAVFNESESADPRGLYSARSNIGWEDYIKDRLDSELHRCSSTEKDLALVLLELIDVSNDEMFKSAAEEATSFFASRDLLFEYGMWGIAVILPGSDIDNAINKSEKFYQRFIGKFPHSFSSRSSINIGISSRSGRLLNADRIMLEAREALKKAKNDPKTSIIAFRSDPEKYRAFIASQN
jgi:GGDEF domain-containing protein